MLKKLGKIKYKEMKPSENPKKKLKKPLMIYNKNIFWKRKKKKMSEKLKKLLEKLKLGKKRQKDEVVRKSKEEA